MTDIQIVNPGISGTTPLPFSQATVAAGLVFLAGQVALDDNNGVVDPGDAYRQTLVALDRVERVLAEVGGTLHDVVTATAFVTGLEHVPGFNKAWIEKFGDHRPARATVVAGLLMDGIVVEVQPIAVSRAS